MFFVSIKMMNIKCNNIYDELPLVHVAVDHWIIHRVGHCKPVDTQVDVLDDNYNDDANNDVVLYINYIIVGAVDDNGDDEDSDGKFPPAIFPPGGNMSLMMTVGICQSQIPTTQSSSHHAHE